MTSPGLRQNDLYVGTRAVDAGLVTKDQLLECLLERAEERRARDGRVSPRPLGTLLVARGFIRQDDLERILSEHGASRNTTRRYRTDRRLGNLVVAANYAWATQVQECLQVQRTELEAGRPRRRLGEILVDRGYLTSEQVDRLVGYSGRMTYGCPECGARYTVSGPKPGGKVRCRRCGGTLELEALEGTSASSTDHAIRAMTGLESEATAPSTADPDREEVDVALGVYLRQRNMVRREALRAAEYFRKDAARYGIDVPLMDVLTRRRLLSWQQVRQLRGLDLRKVVRSEAWKRQTVPGYRVAGRIAAGGVGTIFRAEPFFGGPPVVLKILHLDKFRDPEALSRFRKEARLLISLAHPNIVRGIELGEFRSALYITMEAVEGRSVQEAVRTDGPLPPARALRLTRQAAEALAYMQREGYLHRDVKPENVLIDAQDRAKLCDLGFATELREEPAGRSELTVGTAGYISPEQARGERNLKVGTDIYSLGLTLYFMLTGQVPFPGDDSVRVMEERFTGGVASPDFSQLPPSTGLERLLRRMLDEDRTRRFTTYPELLDALDTVAP